MPGDELVPSKLFSRHQRMLYKWGAVKFMFVPGEFSDEALRHCAK